MKLSLQSLSVVIPKILFLTLCFLSYSGFSQTAQNLNITGKVTDKQGVTIPGVNIVIKGTLNGTVTDVDGNYAIDVPSDSTVLEFSFLGFKNKSETVGTRRVINVTLESDIKSLSEFVVVGYGVEKRTLLTGAVAEIDQKQLKDLPVPSIDGVMQGQVAGVQVTQNSGTPGGAMSVRIRGISSIGGSSQPLYVIDGIPVTTGDFSQLSFSGQGVNALSDLNPNDIESITVLKDAAAASIYGARASNGVVVITTKRGAAEKTKINFSSYYGMQQAWNTVDMLDAREWMQYRNDLTGTQVFSPEQMNNIKVDTDWQDEIFRTAPIANYELSASGGTEKTRFFMSGNLFDQEGILLGTDYRRVNGRLNLDHTINDKLTIGTSIGLTYSKTDRVESDQSLHGVLPNGISTPAIYPVYNPDGTYNQDGPYSNAVSIGNEYISESYSYRAVGNVYGDYKILPNLKFSTKWGIDFLNYREHSYESTILVQGAKYNGLGFETYSNILNLVSNNFLTYTKKIDKHNIEVLGGYSFEQYQTASSSIRGQDFADQSLEYISSASTIVSASASASFSGIRSFFGRANYNFDNKYLLSVSGRLDGSSRFGENNRNGFFPAVSAGWRINEEDFMDVAVISELKLRASYGLTGNDDIPAFLFAELYGNTSYGGLPAIYPSNIPNPDLKWESTAQFNIGFDLGLFEDRVVLSADYYDKQTKDLLLSRPLPPSSGFSSITQNVGEVENKGIELAITTQNYVGDFTWSTRLNLSGNRNKVLKLYNGEPIDDLGRGSSRIEEGEPIGIFYSYNSLGVDPSTGDIVFEDTNFDGVITAADRTKVGNPHPDFIGGITNTFGYKGFDLSIFFQFSYGNDVFNGNRLFLESLQGGDNQVADIERRWRQPGDITDIPRATTDPIAAASNKRVSSRFIEDGSYMRLKNLTFGYTFQNDWKNIENLRIYFSGQNLLTFTEYSGLDPEVNYRGDDNAVIGTDFFTYPQARTFILGLNLSF
ncbi:TonB-dependent receptor [Cryomorpha ignava]|uniref:TonB-dependent receptor n=1 Tax=Cryomorpha ignava TaxID=101383 RepID=A0A7K3WNH2_9FLAO|nr:TonB-dependent receptor [Cryomorpha ignava]NEN23200.1 TonB-dependent receptor [Cryomorpha ignava]